MLGFLNEQSLSDHHSLADALTFFLSAAQELSATDAILFKDSSFFQSADFARDFNRLGLSKDIRALITQLVFGQRYYRCWRPNRVSSEQDTYTCHTPALKSRDQSLCEAAEQKLRDNGTGIALLSSINSDFQDHSAVVISKDGSGETVQLAGATSLEAVERWISSQRGYYDPRSPFAPRDFQTILLISRGRFQKTAMIERNGRRVFQEIQTGRYYYVCSAHPGESAHLEVFSRNYEHVGKANINSGEIDYGKRVVGRRLKF